MREYQKNFISIYDGYQNLDNRIRKAKKFNYILDKLNIHDIEGTCLDIGCSNGIVTYSISPMFKQIVGVDIDLTAIQMAVEAHDKKTSYANADAMALPFGEKSFDAIICSQTYEHVPSSERLFKEIDRIIKPGGILIFSGPNKSFPIEPHYYLPFLHWFNEKTADLYLLLTRKGNHYYERPRTYWNLEKVFIDYEIIDVLKYVLEYYGHTSLRSITRIVYRITSKLPTPLLRLIAPFLGINWILIKREYKTDVKQKIRIAT